MRRLFRNDGMRGGRGALRRIAMRIATGLAIAVFVCPSLSASAVESEKALPGYNGLTLNTTHYAYGTWTIPVTDAWTLDQNERYVVYPKERHNITLSTPANNSGMHLYECTTTRWSRIPVNKWRLAFRPHICSHHQYTGTNFHGITVGDSSCAQRKEKAQKLSSGWVPTCATCGREYPFYFYGSEEDIKEIDALPAGSFYYSLCVGTNDSNNSACRNMEQGIILDHTCVAQSINRFYIHYDGNGATGGSMKDTMHYVSTDSNPIYEGKQVSNPNGAENKFTKKGHTFIGWSMSPTGAIIFAPSGSQTQIPISTVISQLGNNKPKDGSVVTLYARWAENSSFGTLTIYPNGGTYYGDGKSANHKRQEKRKMINSLTILAHICYNKFRDLKFYTYTNFTP